MDDAAVPLEVVTMGRCGVDIYPTSPGSLVDVSHFEKFLGGSPTNVAVAAARLGHRTAVITGVGDDPFGAFVHAALERYGVSDRFVVDVAGGRTPVTFCELFPPDTFPIYFYRDASSPDLQVTTRDLDLPALASAAVFWVTLSGLSTEPSRSATLDALRARARKHPTVIDLDFRPTFWTSSHDAREYAGLALEGATVAVGNLDEVEVAVGSRDPREAADLLLSRGLTLAVIKMGSDGVYAATPTESVTARPLEVDVVNGLGAGDAFGGALCHGLLSGWSLRETVEFANAAGALVAGSLACSDAMPTIGEVESLLKEATRD